MLAPKRKKGPSLPWSYGSWIYNYLYNECLSPLMSWVRISIRARCTTLCDEVCQRRATGRWFSPCPPVSSINKTDRHEMMEILLKVALNTIKQNKKEKPNEKRREWYIIRYNYPKESSIITTRPFSLPCYLQGSKNGRVVTIQESLVIENIWNNK
jgi:hypothetical protein